MRDWMIFFGLSVQLGHRRQQRKYHSGGEEWEKLGKMINRWSGRFIKTGPESDINRLD